jgi:hypothetical protein
MFLDDIGSGSRPIEKPRLVRSDLLANARSGELGHPGEKRGPVGKSQFCHDIEIDRAAFGSQFLAYKVSAFVKEWEWAPSCRSTGRVYFRSNR